MKIAKIIMCVDYRLPIVTSRTVQSVNYKTVFMVYNETNNKKIIIAIGNFRVNAYDLKKYMLDSIYTA